jgi:hypothetical protein
MYQFFISKTQNLFPILLVKHYSLLYPAPFLKLKVEFPFNYYILSKTLWFAGKDFLQREKRGKSFKRFKNYVDSLSSHSTEVEFR